jgi:pimeloyl-ACP methyl ester carboxylesterase/DNA-binding winged helix-turn-helix (wHTH) protein
VVLRFDTFELDMDRFELRQAGEPVRMEPQVFDVLAYLVVNRDRLVTKDELLEKVWGDKYVSEAALNSRLMAARRAIGDNGREQRLIRTMHGRGFRFVGEAEESGEAQPGTTAPTPKPDLTPRLEQEVRFCTSFDGTRIAYGIMGEGPTLVKAPNWLTHLEYERESPVWRHWWEALGADHRVIRFDQRGSGLSDRAVEDLSFGAWLRDLEAVVDATGEEKFDLLGISQGGAVAIEYAVRHPERVRKLVLYGVYTRGRIARGESGEMFDATLTLMRGGWGRDNPAYRQMFTSQFMPGATSEQMNWFNELQRISTSGETAARLQVVGSSIDILETLPKVQAPTLVLHAIGDERVPFNEGRTIAAMIPNARLVSLDSRNHLTLADEPAWQKLISEVRAFLAE